MGNYRKLAVGSRVCEALSRLYSKDYRKTGTDKCNGSEVRTPDLYDSSWSVTQRLLKTLDQHGNQATRMLGLVMASYLFP